MGRTLTTFTQLVWQEIESLRRYRRALRQEDQQALDALFAAARCHSSAGAYLARNAFQTIKKKVNYEEYGGMPLLGVNGICIIAHGASTPKAIKNALRVAAESIEHQVNPHIVEEVRRHHEKTTSLEPALR